MRDHDYRRHVDLGTLVTTDRIASASPRRSPSRHRRRPFLRARTPGPRSAESQGFEAAIARLSSAFEKAPERSRGQPRARGGVPRDGAGDLRAARAATPTARRRSLRRTRGAAVLVGHVLFRMADGAPRRRRIRAARPRDVRRRRDRLPGRARGGGRPLRDRLLGRRGLGSIRRPGEGAGRDRRRAAGPPRRSRRMLLKGPPADRGRTARPTPAPSARARSCAAAPGTESPATRPSSRSARGSLAGMEPRPGAFARLPGAIPTAPRRGSTGWSRKPRRHPGRRRLGRDARVRGEGVARRPARHLLARRARRPPQGRRGPARPRGPLPEGRAPTIPTAASFARSRCASSGASTRRASRSSGPTTAPRSMSRPARRCSTS